MLIYMYDTISFKSKIKILIYKKTQWFKGREIKKEEWKIYIIICKKRRPDEQIAEKNINIKST